jgi:hypothetical protein
MQTGNLHPGQLYAVVGYGICRFEHLATVGGAPAAFFRAHGLARILAWPERVERAAGLADVLAERAVQGPLACADPRCWCVAYHRDVPVVRDRADD